MARRLFREHDIFQVLDTCRAKIRSQIDRLSNDTIMGNDLAILCHNIYEQHKIVPVEILPEDEGRRDISQAKIKRTPYYPGSRNEVISVTVDGLLLRCFFPFRGSAELFYCQGSTFDYAPYPEIDVEQNYFVLEFQYALQEASESGWEERVAKDKARDLASIQNGLNYVNKDVHHFDEGLKPQILKWLEEKRKKVEIYYKAAKLVDVSVNKKADGCCNIAVVRRIVPIAHTYTPQEVSYSITSSNYNEIMAAIKHTASSMEQTPRSYRSMEEEDLRNVLLASLNGTFQGDAKGEAFRGAGKTDIVIEAKDRAAFVAECKMWTGESEVEKALQQLDGYLTWRDCKTALIFFVRRKDFCAILTKAQKRLEAIPMLSQIQVLDKNELRGFMASTSTPGQRKEVRFLLVNMYFPEQHDSPCEKTSTQ